MIRWFCPIPCRLQRSAFRRFVLGTAGILLGIFLVASAVGATDETDADRFRQVVSGLTADGDRSTGTPGNRSAVQFIEEQFTALDMEPAGVLTFAVPVRMYGGSRLVLPDRDQRAPVHPIVANSISPETVPVDGLSGPLIYVGRGDLADFNGAPVKGSIVLMELDSGRNWRHAASMGARALIYLDRGPSSKTIFSDKFELTPIRFPRFWMPIDQAREFFGRFENAPEKTVLPSVRLESRMAWQEVDGRNLYYLIEGADPELAEELIIVEAFYDSTALIPGRSPGADEACGVATLLDLARRLKENPPGRSVLLVATGGHAQSLAGMREMIWSLSGRTKHMRQMARDLKKEIRRSRDLLEALDAVNLTTAGADTSDPRLKEALASQIKLDADAISRRLMALRLEGGDQSVQQEIHQLAEKRLVLRRMGWRTDFADPTPEERDALNRLVPRASKHLKAVIRDAEKQEKQLKSARRFRSLVREKDLAAVVSLHLSSHGDGIGAFNDGWLFSLKPTINRTAAYSIVDEVLRQGARKVEASLGTRHLYHDTLRPSRLRSWQSYFLDRPPLGGELSALAGLIGVSLVTVNDARPLWGTPYDQPEAVDYDYAATQSGLVCGLVRHMSRVPRLHGDTMPRNGFSVVSGRASLLLHGDLFAEEPAPESYVLAFQGDGLYHARVDSMGRFQFRGVADKKHVYDKVILEGYRFDPDTGKVVWAIDKKQTGKPAYRVKMQRRAMETDLIMFSCRQSTLFNLLEPRSFRYMTKIQLYDGRLDAPPLRYWYSRIDTRDSIISSLYLEPGTRYKMTLSDTVLKKKLILTNATPAHPGGEGYRVDEWPLLHNTEYRVARDMWTLLNPRIENLEAHGIYDNRIRTLQQEGLAALSEAESSLTARRYDRFAEASTTSWALASRVYTQVEKTQKDVLFGVLFYIALFVPFAFCMERLLFSFSDIHKRIVGFLGILFVLITLIYNVHPAFELAYSPTVVILAFFIMGLSLIVTLIIFFRFEQEMTLLQRHARQMRPEEISRWKAFLAAFFLGVSNLRRRRLRTALTCATLIILTFTIMSFTSVKSVRHHARILYEPGAPYQGFLMKNLNWWAMPPETFGVVTNAFGGAAAVAPRVWLESEDPTRAVTVTVRRGDRVYDARGVVGLSPNEAGISGMDRILDSGRWFRENEQAAVLLPRNMADYLGVDPDRPETAVIRLWGESFQVVGTFPGESLQNTNDLDGEPLTPVIFPGEASMLLTEAEMEAMESGEDVHAFQSRYQHIVGDLTIILPSRTLLAAGGRLKSLAVGASTAAAAGVSARNLVDRFGLSLFSGEPGGTFLYHAGDAMSYSGVPNILIPLLISIFIVLNTMIGSVYERKQEIGIYTSVGLAPSHVGFLFIAEAMAFAVLSVVLGYLLAQTTAKLFAGTSLWAGITVNYSSMAGVAAMVLVMLVVLISVIYPSRVAAEIAIPDVNRSWTMPDPRENVISVTLPFLMKRQEHLSAGGYLLEIFQGHQDVSHGLFSTGDVSYEFIDYTPADTGRSRSAGRPDDPCLHIFCRVWLAPFDFGIMQRIGLQFRPSADETGFLEIRVNLEREAGEANAWSRINKIFLNELRKHLLVWRSMDAETKRHYESLVVTTPPAISVPLG